MLVTSPHQPTAAPSTQQDCDDDPGRHQGKVVVPAVGGETTDASGNNQQDENKTKQEQRDAAAVPVLPTMQESSGIFESSVFVRLGQSLEFSSSPHQHQIDDQIRQHENVSIISGEEDEAKEKDDSDTNNNDNVDDSSFVWTSDDVDHLTTPRNKSARRQDGNESIFHRIKAAVAEFANSAIPWLVAQHNNPPFSLVVKPLLDWTDCLLIVILAMGVSMMMNDALAPTSPNSMMQQPSPKQDLQSFVALERDRNSGYMDKLEDLRTEGFQRYARSACVAAGTLEQAQKALFIQLSGIPEDVRTHTIERALIEGITHRSSMQDSSSQLGSQGRAHSYMAFWSTVYHHPRRGRGRHHDDDDFNTYESCVLVAGMEIGVTEVIAGYKTEEKKVVVGSTPCECGYFYCAGTCPLFSKVIERTPIFQRHSLSLKQQDDLHRWLVKNAIDAAEGLVSGGSNVPNILPSNDTNRSAGVGGGGIDNNTNKNTLLSAQVEVLAWKKPPLVEAFYSDHA